MIDQISGESFADDIPAVGDDILSRWRRQRKVEVAKQRLTVESSAPRLPDKVDIVVFHIF